MEYGTRGERHTIAEGVKQVLTLPPFLAAVVGLLVNISGLTVPEFVMDFTRVAGHVVAPVMLFSIGLALKEPKLSTLPLLTPSLLIKLVVAPAIGFVLIGLFISDVPTARATLLEAAMPTMVLTIVFAEPLRPGRRAPRPSHSVQHGRQHDHAAGRSGPLVGGERLSR